MVFASKEYVFFYENVVGNIDNIIAF